MKLLRKRRPLRAAASAVELLESRCLLSATLVSQIPSQTVSATSAPINLTTFFNDPTITPGDTLVEIQTNMPGPANTIPILLTDAATPQTVANFLHYITSGEWAHTIFHRSVPGFIIQAGGDNTDGSQIQGFGMIPGESATATVKNTTGTIAMALSSGPDSATDEWFINLANNDGSGSTPNLDDTSDGGPFTAFGSVIYNGMDTANAIAALPVVDGTSVSNEWSDLPLQNFTGGYPTDQQFVLINPVIDTTGGLTFSATSSNTSVVSTSITGGNLSFTPVANGTSNITVTATDLGGGTVTSIFAVTVGDQANSASFTATVGSGAGKAINFTDADGTTAQITLKGPGTATVSFNGSSLAQVTDKKGIEISGTGVSISGIVTTGTTAASILTITTKGGTKAINVGALQTDSLKSFVGTGVTLIGDVTATGTIGSLTIAGAQGGTITAGSVGAFVNSGNFSDNLTLNGGGVSLTRFSAAAVTGGTWSIAGTVSSLTITKQDLMASISAVSIPTLRVKGNMTTATLNLTGGGVNLNTLAVGGAITGSTVNSVGSLGAISAASMINSNIYAGMGNMSSDQVLPTSAANFIASASIKSVRLKLVPGTNSFSDSAIAASNLVNLSLGTLLTNGGFTVSGIASQNIGVFAAAANKRFTMHKLNSTTDMPALLTATGVDLGALVVQLF
jgi:cyclophilin family peptidyl-prolyl cis-trans isomerase